MEEGRYQSTRRVPGAVIFFGGLLAMIVSSIWLDNRKSDAPETRAVRQTDISRKAALPAQVRPAPAAEREERIAVKCVEPNGRTTYVATLGECASGSSKTEVAASPRMNVADGMTPQQRATALQQRPAEQQSVARSASPPDPAAGDRNVCAALDEKVRLLDQYARQPLPAFEQDRIRAERKDARDKQFRMRCQ